MDDVPENVRRDLLKLVPASLFKDITCFAFYDNHPQGGQNIDVIICTTVGEVIELYKRQSVLTLTILTDNKPGQISLHRGSKCDLVYLVLAGEELFVLLRKDELVCNVKVCNVVSYSVYDFNNVGEPHLRVTISDDAVPVVFDEDYKIVTDKIHDVSATLKRDRQVTVPIETDLDVKLAITRYNFAYNMKSLENMKNLRQVAAFALYQKIHPNLKSSIFNNGLQELSGALKIRAETPWTKTCHGKVVLVLPVCNENPENLEEIHILFQGYDSASLTYTTKLFQSISKPPYWQEVKTQNLMKDTDTSIAVVLDLAELKHSIMRNVEFKGVIMYKLNNKEKLVPFQQVSLSMLEILGDSLDVFSSKNFDKKDFLAVLATSYRTDLVLRNIQKEATNMEEALCVYLKMQRLAIADNVLVHISSPCHALNGVMVTFEREFPESSRCKASVYSRNESQVLALIYCINDAVPSRVVISTPNQRLTPHHAKLLHLSEVTAPQCKRMNLEPLVRTTLDHMALLLKYYDDCMMKMNESRDEDVVSKIGLEIDVFACGVARFKELRKCLIETVRQNVLDFESMIVESTE